MHSIYILYAGYIYMFFLTPNLFQKYFPDGTRLLILRLSNNNKKKKKERKLHKLLNQTLIFRTTTTAHMSIGAIPLICFLCMNMIAMITQQM